MNHFNGQKYHSSGSVANFCARSTPKRPRYASNVIIFFFQRSFVSISNSIYWMERRFPLLNGNVTLLRRFHVDYPQNPFQVLPNLAYKNLVPRSLVDEAVANLLTWLDLTCCFDDKRSGYEINAHCLISNFNTSISVVSFSLWFISFCDSSLSSARVKRFLSSSTSFSNDAILVCCSMFFSDQLLLSCSRELCASDNESNSFCRSIRRFSRVFFYQKERQ